MTSVPENCIEKELDHFFDAVSDGNETDEDLFEEILLESSDQTDQNKQEKDSLFDEVLGVMEEILLSPQFMEIQDAFLDKYCDDFENSEENKVNVFFSLFS